VINAHVEELIIIDDVGQNQYKAERLMELRAKLLKHFPAPEPSNIMLLRKNTGSSRLLVNEMEIAEKLSRQGFRILSPLETSAEELIQACLGAKIVVGIEGSHLAHAVLCMAPGSALLTIQPPDRFDATLKDWCDCKQIRYAFTVGELCSEGGFETTEHQIDRLLQQLG
jgi:capsular polysaccharide biosynthesis protein